MTHKLTLITLSIAGLMATGVACKDADGLFAEVPEKAPVEELETLATKDPPAQPMVDTEKTIDERIQDLEKQLDALKEKIAAETTLHSKYAGTVKEIEKELADARTKADELVDSTSHELDEAVAKIEQQLDEIAEDVGA